MAVAEGVDYSAGRPSMAGLVAAGKSFVVRYVSPSAYKNLDAAERDALHTAGMAICLVWENRSDDALAGATGGAADARSARAQARALGFPDSLPIYHAVDFDATDAQLTGPVHDYFEAAAAVHGGVGLVGAYGGIRTITYLLDHGLVRWGWQTYAWSGGHWEPRAQLQQYHNGVQVAGADCDLDRAMVPSFGQWPPTGGGEGPTVADLQPHEVVNAIVNGSTDAGYVQPTGTSVGAARDFNLRVLTGKVDDVAAAITAPAPVDVQALAAALAPLLADPIRVIVREELDKTHLAS